nr:hypothetical protein [uncultured Rhodoferax sp.]
MKIKINSQPQFMLPLTLETVDLLMEMSRHHYDGVCKSASAVGGFIYGWHNSVTFMPESHVRATWRELDTMLKICEISQLLSGHPGERETIRRLVQDVHKAMRHWNDVSKGWCVSIDTEALGHGSTVL